MLREKVTEIEERISKADFQCSSSWITRFRQRHNIVFGEISGGSASFHRQLTGARSANFV